MDNTASLPVILFGKRTSAQRSNLISILKRQTLQHLVCNLHLPLSFAPLRGSFFIGVLVCICAAQAAQIQTSTPIKTFCKAVPCECFEMLSQPSSCSIILNA